MLAANQAQNDSQLAVAAAKQFGALVIDPATNTISPTDQASAMNNLNDTESIINRIKNQSNLISLNDGQLSVPEIPLRRRLSQHNEARKSFRSQSIKDDQNREFNNLHKINEEKKKTDAFPGRQASLKGRSTQLNEQSQINNPYQQSGLSNQEYAGNQPPFSTPTNSTYGYQTESPQSFISQQSRNHNLVRQSSQTNPQFQQQHASSMYQSQPHLVRPNSSAYASQRPPLNVQTSFDLGKSMIDHMDHYQSLHNRYASTSKLNQKTPATRNRPPFSSSGNLPNPSANLRQNQPPNFNPNRNVSNLAPNLASSHFKTTPDSGIGSLEESSTHNYQQHQQQQNLMNPSSHLLQQSQQPLLQQQQHQMQQQQMYPNQYQQLSMLNQGNFNLQQQPPGTPQQRMMQNPLQQQMNPLQQQQFNPMNNPQINIQQPYGSQSNLTTPLHLSGLQQQPAFNQQMNPMQQQQQFNPMNNPMMMNNPQQQQSNPFQQQSMWNQATNFNTLNQQPFQQQQQQPQFQQSANPFQTQSSPPLPQSGQLSQQLSQAQLNELNFQQQSSLQNRQAVQQQLTQQADLMNNQTSQSIQNKEKQLEQHYGRQTDESLANSEPKRSSWRTASLFRPGKSLQKKISIL